MQDAGKEDYLRPSERIGLDWIVGLYHDRRIKRPEPRRLELLRGVDTKADSLPVSAAISPGMTPKPCCR